jgi:hypothetical protein
MGEKAHWLSSVVDSEHPSAFSLDVLLSQDRLIRRDLHTRQVCATLFG